MPFRCAHRHSSSSPVRLITPTETGNMSGLVFSQVTTTISSTEGAMSTGDGYGTTGSGFLTREPTRPDPVVECFDNGLTAVSATCQVTQTRRQSARK